MIVFAFLVVCCLSTGWLLGHAAAVVSPFVSYVAHTVEEIGSSAKRHEQAALSGGF